jgi:hypothetical protein
MARPRTPTHLKLITGRWRRDRHSVAPQNRARQAAKVLGVGETTIRNGLRTNNAESARKVRTGSAATKARKNSAESAEKVRAGSAATKAKRAKMTKAECELWRETFECGDDFFGHLATIFPGWTAEDPAAIAAARKAWRQCGKAYMRDTWPKAQIYLTTDQTWAEELFGRPWEK